MYHGVLYRSVLDWSAAAPAHHTPVSALLTPLCSIDDYCVRQWHRPAWALLSQATPALPETRVTNIKITKDETYMGIDKPKEGGLMKRHHHLWHPQMREAMPPSFSSTIRMPTFPISCHPLSLWEEHHRTVFLRWGISVCIRCTSCSDPIPTYTSPCSKPHTVCSHPCQAECEWPKMPYINGVLRDILVDPQS